MGSGSVIFTQQLREACKSTGARWVVWAQYLETGWELYPSDEGHKGRLAHLLQFIRTPQTTRWMAGALSSGRIRSRRAGSQADVLGCQNLFLFPNSADQGSILVGADELNKLQRDIFRILALCGPRGLDLQVSGLEDETLFQPFEDGFETSYDPDRVLNLALDMLTHSVACDAAYLAIRSGDIFRIQVAKGCPRTVVGQEISLQTNPQLVMIVESQHGAILNLNGGENHLALIESSLGKPAQQVMKIPVVHGRRVIGEVAFISTQPNRFKSAELRLATTQLGRVVHVIENAMVFAEAVRYLQQFALLNDLALSAAGGLNTDEVARRVVHRLKRFFETDQVAVLLLSEDHKSLLEYGSDEAEVPPLVIRAEGSLAGYVVEHMETVRQSDLTGIPAFYPPDSPVNSVLFVPLKYRGEAIGTLGLQSLRSNAFSPQDEQLLTVVASHLAGMLENARLHQEARERAGKLALIHDVIERILRLKDEMAIAQETADLVAGAFNYELVTVLTADETGEYLVNLGVGGSNSHSVSQGQIQPVSQGLTGKTFRYGRSVIYNDVRQEPEYYSQADWQAEAQMCVPLYERERVFGLINIESAKRTPFSESDVMMMESLAGILASVIVNARRYRELKHHIEMQQQAENRLVRSARLAAVGEMAAGVAHELNNPLTTVLGFLELALEDLPENGGLHGDLAMAASEALRAREVVRRLLDFSRQSGNVRVHCGMNELLNDVLSLVQHQIQTSGVNLDIEQGEEIPEISVNPNQIKQVMLNLLQNALQAMQGGGTLRVRTGRELRLEGLGAFLKVCDTGEGIPPENYERIFEPFFTTREVGKGTGLGLSVSYGIVTSHGGHIDVESVLSRGSCFTVWLPAERER